MKHTLERCFDKTLNFFASLACLIILFQVLSVSAEVFLRYFFKISFPWVMTINEWGLVYIAFLGAAWLQREGGHVGDSSISVIFPLSIRKLMSLIGDVLAIGSCLVLTVYGLIVTHQKYINGVYDYFKIEYIPVYLVFMVIPFGGFLWLIQIIRGIIKR